MVELDKFANLFYQIQIINNHHHEIIIKKHFHTKKEGEIESQNKEQDI